MHHLDKLKSINDIAAGHYARCNAGRIDSFPVNVFVTVTHECNYRCRMCYVKEHRGDVDPRVWEALDPVLPFVRQVTMLGGEPLVYRDVDAAFARCFGHGCAVSLCTNGTLLTPERNRYLVDNPFHRITVSMDAATAETYRTVRGGSFRKVVGNVRDLVERKARQGSARPEVLQFNFVAMRENIRELPALVELAADLGIDIVKPNYLYCDSLELAGSSLYFAPEVSDECMLAAEARARELGVHFWMPSLFTAERDSYQSAELRDCLEPWREFYVLDLAGEARLCCGGNGILPPLGNLVEDGFDAVWNGPLARKVRQTINTDSELTPCRQCWTRRKIDHDIAMHIPDQDLADRARRAYQAPAEQGG